MTPVGATGERAPDCAPLPTMIAIRKGGIAARPATAMAIGASMAAVATLPGPREAMTAPSTKNITGMSPVFPRQMRTAACVTLSSVPFSVACEKSKRHASQRQEDLRREAVQHVAQAHAPDVHADDPGQCQREDADVQRRGAADDHDHDERAKRYPGECHKEVGSITVKANSPTALRGAVPSRP